MFDSLVIRPALLPMDTASLLSIEKASFPEDRQWNAHDFTTTYNRPGTHIMVVEQSYRDFNTKINKYFTSTRIIGFFIYSVHIGIKHIEYYLESLAILPENRRTGLASMFIDKLMGLCISCLTDLDRSSSKIKHFRIRTVVGEDNLPAHLLLRKLGFIATHIVKDYFTIEGLDGYTFTFHSRMLKDATQKGRTEAHT